MKVLIRGALVAFVILIAGSAPRAAGRGEPGPFIAVRIDLENRIADLKLLNELEIDVDGVFGTWARAYVIPEEIEKLTGLGFKVAPLPEEPIPSDDTAPPVPNQYHTYETLTAELQQIAAAHPSIARLYSLGKSVQNRDLWMMKITRNPDIEEDEPEIRYIAAMHGDEVVGKEMCVNLINLLTFDYGSDPRVTALVDTTEIWILPSMNPDGTALHQRYNANFIDLNRNFPDQFTDPTDSPAGRAIETQHVMNWGYAHSTNLSANFHGGALVANYAYDCTASGASTYSWAPDDSLWVSLARTYADNNLLMSTSNADPSFNDGICNGSDWYCINGGMQDWNYVWRGGKELTLEISNIKWPQAFQLPTFWNQNRESMLSFFERVHAGIRGIVTDSTTGAPLAAVVKVVGSDRDTLSDPDVGDYHRILLPGLYDLEFSSVGYSTAVVEGVSVGAGSPATRVDVALEPLDVNLQHAAHEVLDGAGGNGELDAGETADLGVTLRDLGLAATGISAWIEPTDWFGRATRPEASYPDLVAGQSGESLAPHHGISALPAAPAGHKLGFVLQWTSDQGSGTTQPFFLDIGPQTCSTVASTGGPLSIQDRATTTSTIAFAPDREISEVNVRVDVTHPYIGDLHVSVISPAGAPVALHGRSGGSADNIVGWYDADFSPAEPLSRLDHEHSVGTWKLEVTDGVPVNTGTLNGWSLEVCGRPFEASTPEMKLHEVSKAPGKTILTWWPYPGITSYKVYRSTSPSLPFVDVTSSDPDPTDTRFEDTSPAPALCWKVSGVGPQGEGPK